MTAEMREPHYGFVASRRYCLGSSRHGESDPLPHSLCDHDANLLGSSLLCGLKGDPVRSDGISRQPASQGDDA